MRLKRIIAAAIGLAVLLGSVSFAASLPSNVGNYFIGYPSGLQSYMKKFNMAITDVRNYTKDEVTALKANGTTVIGYVSVGETVTLDKGNGQGPGGYASYYFDTNNDGMPDKNVGANSYYTNAADPLWVQEVLNVYAKEVYDKGADGVFLDTVSTADLYPQSQDGMVNLIKSLRERFSGKIIIQNWGFGIVERTAPYINAEMWESWYPDSTNPWTINWQNKFKELKSKYGMDLLTLGYYDNYTNLQRYFEASKALGFIPFVDSTQNRDLVVNYFSARSVAVNSVPTPPPPVTSSSEVKYLLAYLQPYKTSGIATMIGPISWTSGWSVVRSYYGMLHREARGWDAGVEFTIPDKTKNAEIGVYYLDDKAGNLLGLSYYGWDSLNQKPKWTTKAVKKTGSGYVRSYKFIIPKAAFVDNDPKMTGTQVVVGIGGLCPVDKIKSVSFRQY